MWKRLSTNIIYKHPRVVIKEDEVELADGKRTKYWYFGSTTDTVTIICRDNNKILLQRAHNYPLNKVLYEFPGGSVDKQENLESAVIRELEEETGYKANKITLIGWYYIDNRRKKSKMYVYIANKVKKMHDGNREKEEIIKVHWFTVDQIEKMLTKNLLTNPHLLACWTIFRSRHQQKNKFS